VTPSVLKKCATAVLNRPLHRFKTTPQQLLPPTRRVAYWTRFWLQCSHGLLVNRREPRTAALLRPQWCPTNLLVLVMGLSCLVSPPTDPLPFLRRVSVPASDLPQLCCFGRLGGPQCGWFMRWPSGALYGRAPGRTGTSSSLVLPQLYQPFSTVWCV